MSSIDQLKRAIAIAEKIETLKAELETVLGGESSAGGKQTQGGDKAGNSVNKLAVSKPVKVKAGKRTMSPEARARIVAAQKARWAKIRGEKRSTASQVESKSKPEKRGKRVVSAEARARMAEAARKRWAMKK